jgi:hypothetical protein
MADAGNPKVCAAVAIALVSAATALVVALIVAPVASARSSDHGASFAVRCDFSHRAQDDPIVHPGQPGMSHSHDFFGNTSTSAHATAAMLRLAETTCTRPHDTAAYWMPTVEWNGLVIESNRAVFYYRAGGKNHTKVLAHPAGLKVVTPVNQGVSWRCGRTDNGGGRRTPPSRCASGELGVRIIFPDCSNGKLDSANHRSHMVYSRPIDGKKPGCPRSHPISVPVLTMNVTFRLPTNKGPVRLSSGRPSSMHADFFNAWRQKVLKNLVSHCIRNVPPTRPRPPECRA